MNLDVMNLAATLTLNTSEFNAGLNASEKKMKGLTSGGVAFGNLIATAVTTAARAVTNFAKDTVKVGMEFDAQMSQVKALGQLGNDEFIQLRQRAMQLGETTKFTAAQVGEAFSYMALAGWDTQEMLDGIEGVLNLAAASGEDLGRTSDIVTDALTALGLTAKDTQHFVDVLAAASANSNTTVSQMGEAFKYLATTGGVLEYSIDDIATTLGLLANNGIKASQAGTSMRQILNTLINPTDKAADAMNKLGVSLFDPKTNARKPLGQVLQEFRDVFKGAGLQLEEGFDADEIQSRLDALNEWYDAEYDKIQQMSGAKTKLLNDLDKEYQEKFSEQITPNQAFLANLGDIGGLRGISSLFAIMNSTDEDFQQLTEAISKSKGSAYEMAATMLDNLQGDIRILNSAIEGLQIVISDSFNEQMRSIVQGLTTEIGNLNKAFQEGGIQGFFAEAGRALLNVITSSELWSGVFAVIKGIMFSVIDKILGTHYYEQFQFELRKENLAKASGYDSWSAMVEALKSREEEKTLKAVHGKPLYDLLVDQFYGEGMQTTAVGKASEYLQKIFGITAEEAYKYAGKIYTAQYGEDAKSGRKIQYTEGAIENLQASLSDLISNTVNSQEAMAALKDAADSASEALYSIPHYGVGGSFAKGQWDVPHDMSARLHRGEMVLTASQARRYRDGDGMGGTTAIVSVIQGLRQDMQNLQLVVNGKTFGRASVQYGGDRMNGYIGKSERRAAAGHGW